MRVSAIIIATRSALEAGSALSATAVGAIRQTLESFRKLGIRQVAIVDGRDAEQLRDRLALHELPELDVRVIANHSWKTLSGSAVLLAREWIQTGSRCLIVRGERPLALEHLRGILELAIAQPESDAVIGVSLAGAAEPGTDVRVSLVHESDTDLMCVEALGEDLANAEAVYTGHALVSPAILDSLMSVSNPTLEHGLIALAKNGRVLAHTMNEWAWGSKHRIDIADKVTALLDSKRQERYVLLNPGPVNTSPVVKSALVHHDVCHRDSVFSELMVSMTNRLRRIFRGTPHHTVVTITGSGTAAMEAALASTVPADGKILIIDNGAFGARLVEVATVHDMNIVHMRYDWGECVSIDDVENAFAQHPDIAVVAMIHHETSVGLLNPVGEVGALCKKHDALLVVDAVSSLGAEDIDVVRDNIDVCYASANKCLHAVSGASFMCIAPRVWERVQSLVPRSYYLDLRRYRKYMDELAQTPFTPAVSIYFALDAACAEFLADGHEARFEMYRSRNKQLRDGLSELGMTSFTRSGMESNSIVTCKLPDGVGYTELYDAVKARGVILYGCKGVLADRYMQIANMGYLSHDAIEEFLAILADEIAQLRASKAAALSDRSSRERLQARS